MQLRGLLRAVLQPSEHIVGWGTATRASPPFETLRFSIMMAVPPLAGVLFALLSTRKRVLVLTDRRLLVVQTATSGEAPARRHVTLDAPLRQVRLPQQKPRAFRLYLPPRPGKPKPPPRHITLARTKAPPAKALAEGLALIADPSARGDAPRPERPPTLGHPRTLETP